MGKLWGLAAALALCACSDQRQDVWLGYAEGESVHVAAPVAGQLAELKVQRGDQVAQGAPLFALEQAREKSAVDEGSHRLAQAQAQLELAQSQLKRQQDLRAKGLSSIEQLDAARTQAQTAQSRVDELTASLAETQWMRTQKPVAAPAAGVSIHC